MLCTFITVYTKRILIIVLRTRTFFQKYVNTPSLVIRYLAKYVLFYRAIALANFPATRTPSRVIRSSHASHTSIFAYGSLGTDLESTRDDASQRMIRSHRTNANVQGFRDGSATIRPREIDSLRRWRFTRLWSTEMVFFDRSLVSLGTKFVFRIGN